MSVRSYRSGDWIAAVGDRLVLAVPPAAKTRVAALWPAIDDGAGFDRVLDLVLADGLADLRGLVLVELVDGHVRALVRAERAHQEKRAALLRDIDVGLADLEAGRVHDGEAVFAELLGEEEPQP